MARRPARSVSVPASRKAGTIPAEMKVAVIIQSIDVRRGGAETSTVQFVHELARRACDVHVITTSRVPSSPAMTVHTLPVQRGTRGSQAAQFMRRAADEIQRGDFDVVHSMLPIPGCDVYQPRGGTAAESVQRNLALIRSRVGRRAKRIGNRLNAKQQAQLRQERQLFARSPDTLVAAVSQYVVDQLVRHYRLPESRIRLVYNGVDVAPASDRRRRQDRRGLREQFGIGPETLVLLMVAHNFRLKGVAKGIEAVAELVGRHDPPMKLLVVGRDTPTRFERAAQRLGVADRIIFVGPSDRVGAFYHAADLLIHPTYYDPCSRVVLEALVSGLPAITTRHNGAAEVIEDGVHGYVIDSADAVDKLVEGIERLMDEAHRRQCRRQGRLLRDRLSMARHADEMLTVYEEIVRRRTRP